MENLKKSPGKGVFMKKTWEELQKSGSPAMSMNDIVNFLEVDGKMLERQEVMDIVKRYFDRKLKNVVDEYGNEGTIWLSPPRKAEFAAALGVDTTTLARYVTGEYNGNEYVGGKTRGRVNKDDFDIVRKAYQIIQDHFEGKLSENRNPAGICYWLNNSANEKWSNEQSIRVSAENTRFNEPQISRDELLQIAESTGAGEIDGGMEPDF